MMYLHKLMRVSFAQFMISDVGRGLLVNFQIGYTLVVLDVAGDKDKVVMGGCRRNEEIRLVNKLAFSSEIAAYECILFGNRAGNP